MSRDITQGFSKPVRPRSLIAAAVRFVIIAAIAFGLYLFTTISWGGWNVALIIGLITGVLWAVSWCWDPIENRVIAWAVIYLGITISWALICRDMPSFGALVSMYLGYEFIQVLLYNRISAWINTPINVTKKQNKSEMATPRKPSD